MDIFNRTISFFPDNNYIRIDNGGNNYEDYKNLTIPEGVNIFRLFKLYKYPNIKDYIENNFIRNSNLVIGMSSSETSFHVLFNVFKEIENIHWHSTVPDWLSILLLLLYIPLILMGLGCNIFIMSVIITSQELLKDPRHCFILSLSISDFFLCFFTSPMTLWQILIGHWPINNPNSEFLCQLLVTAQDFPLFTSPFFIGAIASDRYRFIMTPNARQMTAKEGFIISMVLASIGIIFVSPIYAKTKLWHFPYLYDIYFCEVDWKFSSRIYYSLVSSGVHFLAIFIIVGVLYWKIYLKMKNRPESNNHEINQRRRRGNIVVMIISLVFFLSWTPVVLYCFTYDFFRHAFFERTSLNTAGFAITLLLGLSSSVTNAIIYTISNEKFKSIASKKLSKIISSGVFQYETY